MNEELERIVQGLFNGAELDSYDKDLIRRIIVEQQKEIDRLNTKIKWLEMVNKEIASDAPKHVKDYHKKSITYKNDGKSNINSRF